jgi:hypothetical protein
LDDLIMRIIKARPKTIGWGIVGTIIFVFLIALCFGGLLPFAFVFFSTMMFSFLPFLIFTFRNAFAGRSFGRGVLIGWANFVLGQFIFLALYQEVLYPKYKDLVPPEGNGVVAAMAMGWLPAMLISGIAITCARDNSIERRLSDD